MTVAVGAGPVAPVEGRFKPNAWERFLTGELGCCHCTACWTFFVIGWVFVLAFLRELASQGDKIFSFDDQPVKTDVIVQAHYAFMEARGKMAGCDDEAHEEEKTCRGDEACSWNNVTKACEDFDPCPGPPPLPRTMGIAGTGGGRVTWIAAIYEAVDNGNLLDDSLLSHIYKFEKELLTTTNGATLKSGEASPWSEDWCLKRYPTVGGANSSGRCAPINQITNLFSVTPEAHETIRAQVAEGYANVPALAQCLCGTAGLCSVCEGNGTVKSQADWPAGVRACLAAAANASARLRQQQQQQQQGPAECASQAQSAMDPLALLPAVCASRLDCAWAPPGASWLCSPTGYSVGDWQGLATGAAKEEVVNKVCSDGPNSWRNMRKGILPVSFDCDVRKARFARTTFVPGNEDPTDEKAYENFKENYVSARGGWYSKVRELEARVEKESEGRLRIIVYSEVTLFSQFMEILLFDAVLSILSMVFVWGYMWFTLESFFLASCAMFEIVFSLPVAMCLWTLILRQKIIFTQMLVIYMILGIGADDAFILYDAWLQARFAEPEEVKKNWTARFAYAYRKSFHAMAITTATTCGSFVIGAVSPLPGVRDFCIFAAVVVLVDWLFCVSFFASAVVVYERFFKSDKRKPGECLGPGCCWGCCRYVGKSTCCKGAGDAEAGDAGAPKKRGMERFCEGPLFEFLRRFRLAWTVFWLLLVVAAACSAGASLRTATKRPPVGRENIDAIRGFDILLSEFSFRGAPHVYFVWGLDAEQPAESWDDLKATPRYGSMGSLASPAGQRELLRLCRAADLGQDARQTRCDEGRRCLVLGEGKAGRCARDERAWREQGMFVPEDVLCATGRHCFMEDFADWWAATKDDCQKKTAAECAAHAGCSLHAGTGRCSSATDPSTYPGLDEAVFLRQLQGPNFTAYWNAKNDLLRSMGRTYEVGQRQEMTGWKGAAGGGLRLAWVGFNGTIPLENSVEEANDWYERWEAFRTTHAGSLGGVQTTDVYLFLVTQNEMVKAALMGIFLSLFVAFLVLLATTLNWWVSLLGLGNILGISVAFLGVMPLLGWSLGENECIFLIAVVGLSVDYTVHLLHSYNHGRGDREERARHALAEMGISVTNSAITTLLASIILFGCGFYFFFQFGAFIFFVIGFSILMSLTFLIPLLILVGPREGQGDFPLFQRRKVHPVEDIPFVEDNQGAQETKVEDLKEGGPTQ